MAKKEGTEEILYLYACDGTKCNGSSNCHLVGGPCSHTSDIGHSIKRINPAIPTRWEYYANLYGRRGSCIIEQVVKEKEL